MIEIYDTTLRDGTQGEGITFSVADKIRIAERLDAFGVHYIEGGWPGWRRSARRAARRRASTATNKCGCCSMPARRS